MLFRWRPRQAEGVSEPVVLTAGSLIACRSEEPSHCLLDYSFSSSRWVLVSPAILLQGLVVEVHVIPDVPIYFFSGVYYVLMMQHSLKECCFFVLRC